MSPAVAVAVDVGDGSAMLVEGMVLGFRADEGAMSATAVEAEGGGFDEEMFVVWVSSSRAAAASGRAVDVEAEAAAGTRLGAEESVTCERGCD